MLRSRRAGGLATLLLVLLALFFGGAGHDAVHPDDAHDGDCTLCLVSGAEPTESPRLAKASWVVARGFDRAPQAPELGATWSSELVRGPPRSRAARQAFPG